MTQIRSVLIANRGEIACRIIKTAHKLGITTVAIYADADATAQHVLQADLAFPLNGNDAASTYLNPEKIIDIARLAKVDAIHPGYGFLSENASFVQKATDAGFIFMGPTAATMAIMGDKAMAKKAVAARHVPLLPGYEDDDQTDATLIQAATKIGFPLIIKPAAGGGGKGMKVAHHADELPALITSAKREALSSFGNPRLILERYLTSPRHIEVQIFGDMHGNVISLFERECTLQRRHQKVIEEAPAAHLKQDIRNAVYEAAIAAGKSVNYIGAGTVEFLLEGDQAYFMEMNTRLQVEHPVTEMITGLDLVALQFSVAEGKPLPLDQIPREPQGHAIEARLYAEDPASNFLPSTGRITHAHFPACRVDTGVTSGDIITHLFDPMLAKIIVLGRNRQDALRLMDAALKQTHICGVKTNTAFLNHLVRHPDVASGNIDVTYIDRNLDKLTAPASVTPHHVALACVALMSMRKTHPTSDSPWQAQTYFRVNQPYQEKIILKCNEDSFELQIDHNPTRTKILGKNIDLECTFTTKDNLIKAYFTDGTILSGTPYQHGSQITLFQDGHSFNFTQETGYVESSDGHQEAGSTCAPMTGKVVDVLVHIGDNVPKGAKLIVMEAMKMEHIIKARHEGEITAIHYTIGDIVEEGKELISITYKEAS